MPQTNQYTINPSSPRLGTVNEEKQQHTLFILKSYAN